MGRSPRLPRRLPRRDARVSRLGFWIPVGLLAWVYAGYPLAAAVSGRIRPFRLTPTDHPPRQVTVGIVARNEAGQIGSRIDDVRRQEVSFELRILVASDGSTDATRSIVQAIAASDQRVRLLDLPAAGVSAAQAAIFGQSRSEVVVLTDAETRFAPHCLERLIGPFRDPRVGATTGRLEWRFDDETGTARQEGRYWRYEQLVRHFESEAGWLTAATTGAVLAVRRSCFRHGPAHASMDHLLPMFVRDQGLRVVAVQDARATDRGTTGVEDQFRSRSRIATQGIAASLLMARRLTPWRQPSAFLALWSHKLLRWATPWLLLMASAGAVGQMRAGRRLYALPPAAGLGAVAMATGGYLAGRRSGQPPPVSFPLAFALVNLAFVAGWLNLLRRRRIASWVHPDS